ncbi:MAG: hypothetical protein ACPLRN_00270, partial [Microgenomates group bacterium]
MAKSPEAQIIMQKEKEITELYVPSDPNKKPSWVLKGFGLVGGVTVLGGSLAGCAPQIEITPTPEPQIQSEALVFTSQEKVTNNTKFQQLNKANLSLWEIF